MSVSPSLSLASLLLLAGPCLLAVIFQAAQLVMLWALPRQRITQPKVYPPVSILKPMAGFDDDLVENLNTHLAVDYPAEVEVLLGVRNADDSAYPVALQFAMAHPDRVRVLLQEGEPGLNPKVNQLITLTRHARHQLLVVTDSNVRVPRHWLRELVAALHEPGIALSSNAFSGVGETTLGSAFDNMTLSSFCASALATGQVAFKMTQIVGKSMALTKTVLAQIGGWEEVKDLLAEDQRLGRRLRRLGYHGRVCPTYVQNVQRAQPLAHFWNRHSRWAMLRFRVLPAVWLEPLLNPLPWALVAVALSPMALVAWAAVAGVVLSSMLYTDLASRITRGYGFALKWLLLVPLRDLMVTGTWFAGMTQRTVTWRGNRLAVGKETTLTRL